MIKQIFSFVWDFSKEPGNPFEQIVKFGIFIPLGVITIILNPLVKYIKSKI